MQPRIRRKGHGLGLYLVSALPCRRWDARIVWVSRLHSDRELQEPFAASLAQVVPKACHLGRINGQGMLKVLFSTEVLPIQILHPLSDDFFI